MKTIQPVTVWFNGQEVEATILSASCMNDNLSISAIFNYQLIQQSTYPNDPSMEYLYTVAQGSLSMTGEAYQNWETNDYAYDWVAQQLNLTITGNYVPPAPPVPPTPTPTPTPTPEP